MAGKPRSSQPLRILLTGFAPFGGESINPSRELVLALQAGAPLHPRVELCAEILPVDRALLTDALHAAIERHRPDVVISVGQATGRPQVDLESTAHNVIDYRDQCDNGGHEAHGEPWLPGAPPQRRVHLPLENLARTLAELDLPVAVSRDAGRHLCNATLYLLLHRYAGLPAFFVHVPLLPEQAARRCKDEPSLPAEVSRRCLEQLLARLPDLLAHLPAPRAQDAPRDLPA